MPNSTKRKFHDIDYEESKQLNTVDLKTDIAKTKKQKKKLSVRFGVVNIYYFNRQQGFTSIPSNGYTSIGKQFLLNYHI